MTISVISIWQPYASLAIHGHKMNETRGWKAPASLIGKRFGIAATKGWLPAQRALVEDLAFLDAYSSTFMPPPDTLPRGVLLGTVLLHSCDLITEETLEDITPAERIFGEYAVGRYAWRLRDPRPFDTPVPVAGKQGIWHWSEPDEPLPFRRPGHEGQAAPRRADHAALR